MENRRLFYKYYDTLFAAKDYAGEVEAVFRHCASYPLQPLEHILELGCGTGNHSFELARMQGVKVTAVDIDSEMLALAHIKAESAQTDNISFVFGRYSVENADLCVALFNVVNYICAEESLRSFFSDIADSLRLHGVFIFDCWNGDAALLDPPGSKMYEQSCNGQKICCHLTSKTDFVKKITTLNYKIDLFDQSDKQIDSESYQVDHSLWTPAQIKALLKEFGLEVETVCIPFKFDQMADDADWKLMFVCRKV
jgi:SAM-dependent methyltransferase